MCGDEEPVYGEPFSGQSLLVRVMGHWPKDVRVGLNAIGSIVPSYQLPRPLERNY